MIELQGRKLNTYKANLHTHSNRSDGHCSPEELIDIYSKAGYDVLAFTDHRQFNLVSTYDGKNMTLISGTELHPAGPRGILLHFLCLNTPEDRIWWDAEAHAHKLMDQLINVGGVFFVAHPYWCGLTAEEVMEYRGSLGIEVYNGTTRYIGKSSSVHTWDDILDRGMRCNAIAVDDMHWRGDNGYGWTMICAPSKSVTDLITALKQGSYYSSQGPEITKMEYKDGIFTAEFSPCRGAVVCSNRCSGYHQKPVNNDSTEEMTSCTVDFNKERGRGSYYFRLQLTDKNGKFAWSNPFYLDDFN